MAGTEMNPLLDLPKKLGKSHLLEGTYYYYIILFIKHAFERSTLESVHELIEQMGVNEFY